MIHLYIGDGKGKTTAATGLAIRASKTLQVLFVQFIKDGKSSEIQVMKNIKNISTKVFGDGKRIYTGTKNDDARQQLEKGINYILKNYKIFEIIILDELIAAIELELITENSVISLLDEISEDREVIITGNSEVRELRKKADLVTEMKKIKHYYDKGQIARLGIEY